MRKHPTTFMTLMLAGCLYASCSLAADPDKSAAALLPQDFAYAVPVQFDGQDALYQTSLPLSVYQNTVRSDLGDLRVFNATGEVVPHMLQLDLHSTAQSAYTDLPYFPLQSNAHAGLDQLSIRVRRNAAGTVLDINSNARAAHGARLAGYLLDASALKQSIQALELDWNSSGESFAGILYIESSDDLTHWSTIVRGAPLASLTYGKHQLLQKRVEFPCLHAKYLRLSWPQSQTPLRLKSIRAELAATRVESPVSWLSFTGSAVAEHAGDYQFDLGAHLPLRRLRIELPQMNTLVQAALFSRSRPEDNWSPAGNATLYKLHHSGQDLHNPDIAVASNHRYWLLRIAQNNGGIGTGLPLMQVGWQAHQLQFLTRGAAPFQIAYGSSEVKPAEFQMQTLMPPAAANKPALVIQPAQTGAQQTLGGDARLRPAPPPLPWKKWLLWAALGMAVLALGWMAFRLLKQMESHDKNKAA